MRKFLRGIFLFVAVPLSVSGCDRRALLVAPISHSAGHIEGQPFCLAKGIVSLTVSYKPPDPVKTTGGTKPVAYELPPQRVSIADIGRGQTGARGNTAGATAASGAKAGTVPAPADGDAPGDPSGPLLGTAQNISLKIDAVHFIPDCDFQYTVALQHDVLHDDEVTIEIDPVTKLLKGVNSILEDKTPAIVAKLADAPGTIFGGASKVAAITKTPFSFEIKHDIDPTDPGSVEAFNRHLRGLTPKIKLVTRPLIEVPHAPAERVGCKEDLCFRTAMPYIIELKTTDDSVARVVTQQVVVVANPYLVASIPVTRAPFVKKEVTLEFKDGMLTKTRIKNPSEVFGFIGIPIDVAKAIVSVPASMLKFEIVQSQNNNALLTEQKRALTLQKEIIDAQRQLLATAAGAK